MPYKINLFDSNGETKYWWFTFLELAKKRTDTENTQQAVSAVLNTLNLKIKKDHRDDFTILRNATIAAFKKQGHMDFENFIDDTFLNYVPIDTSLDTQKLALLVTTLKDLPTKKKFDNSFDLEPSAVAYRQVSFKLNEGIDLKIDSNLELADKKISASTNLNGDPIIIIVTDQDTVNKIHRLGVL